MTTSLRSEPKKGSIAIGILSIVCLSFAPTTRSAEPIAETFRFPLDGEWVPSRGFAGTFIPTWCGFHLADDVPRSADTEVFPAAPGIVMFADIILGYTVVVEHLLTDGSRVTSVYYHLKQPEHGGVALVPSQEVNPDTRLGFVSGRREDHGSRPHLHFGIRNGAFVLGKDPRSEKWFYPGYTTIYRDGIKQCNDSDPKHTEIVEEWESPRTFITVHGPSTQQLAFASNRDASPVFDIYIMNVDGTGEPVNLTNDPTVYFLDPTWSPDGSAIAFRSESGNATEADIYVMNSDGSGVPTNLTNSTTFDKDPAWSPLGDKIAFTRHDFASGPDVYLMNADGSGQQDLTGSILTFAGAPSWSPDGTQIAFHQGSNIYVMNLDGTGLRNLTNSQSDPTAPDFGLNQNPAWSPDGGQIAFTRTLTVNPPNFDVWVIGIDGTNPRRLTDNPAGDSQMTWSADGDTIAFESFRDGAGEIYIMNADGSGQRNLTNNAASDVTPAWGPGNP